MTGLQRFGWSLGAVIKNIYTRALFANFIGRNDNNIMFIMVRFVDANLDNIPLLKGGSRGTFFCPSSFKHLLVSNREGFMQGNLPGSDLETTGRDAWYWVGQSNGNQLDKRLLTVGRSE
jgi:hypothetical protein